MPGKINSSHVEKPGTGGAVPRGRGVKVCSEQQMWEQGQAATEGQVEKALQSLLAN